MIVVTGASGQLGRGIVQQLLKRIPADQIGVSVRNPEKASALAKRGVRVRQGDFADAASLRRAFEGASQVLIVSGGVGEAARREHRTAIEVAREVGARRVFYTSHLGANPRSPFPPMPDHAATEQALRSMGVRFTSLRNGFYAASALMLMGQAFETGELIAPEDGPVSWTAHADLAEAAAIALTDGGRLDGVTPPLTGPEALDLAGVATIASELAGRPITRATVTDQEYRANLLARGVPEQQADFLLAMFAASREGEFSAVDPTLERLLGRPPISIRDVLADTRPSRASASG